MKTWQKAVMYGVSANVPTLVWGDPGIGKSMFIYSLGKAMEVPVEVVIASLREPSDFLGLPVVEGGTVNMAPANWARRLVESDRGLLVFDEITTAPPAVQAALLRVVLERVVGDVALPPSVAIIAAANPAEQAGGWNLSLPLSNRFFHVQAKAPSAAEWGEGVLGGWPVPALQAIYVDKQAQGKADSLVAGFLKARPELLLQVPKNEDKVSEGWASPRSWDMARRLLATTLAAGEGRDMTVTVMGGCVGPGAGLEFASWSEKLDLPDPLALLNKPKSFKPPKDGSTCLVILNNVVHTAIPLLKEEEGAEMWEAAWTILAKASEGGYPDVAIPPAKRLAQAERPPRMVVPSVLAVSFHDILLGQ